MKRTILYFLIIAFGIFLLSSCSKTIRVGFLMDESVDGRWLKDKEIFINQVESHGGEVVFRASEGDIKKQTLLGNEILEQGVDVLVLIPSDQYEAANIVLAAHKKGVPVISYDRMVKNCNLDFYISFDHVDVGELQAKYISTACPSGKYAILGGAVYDNNSFLLRLGQLNVIQPLVDRGDIKVVYDNYANYWSPDEGYRLMKECLKKSKDVDAVLAANDRLAGGAIKALEEEGIDHKVFVSGMDADLDAVQRVFGGTQTMTVYKPIEAIAVKAADISMQIALDQKIPATNLSVNNGYKQIPSLLLPAMIVNRETINLTVVADGYLEENNIIKK
ncbi:MAG: substrate-binding domain-containing protein [Bacteroidales bacterium]|nr:substrate-binding domain-containing protein [Bacteroidales bacterium]MBN2819219.1 substrate-binding domain-containing protein [Bacteroidales bacterium]